MAKKFVKATGLHNLFPVSNNQLNTAQLLTTTTVANVANNNSILFITADATDLLYGYKEGHKYIWAQGQLFNGNDSITEDYPLTEEAPNSSSTHSTIPTSQAVYNAISPLTDEVVLNYDEWSLDIERGIHSDNEGDWIWNSSNKNITISQLPAIVHVNTFCNKLSFEIRTVNNRELSRNYFILASQTYYIGETNYTEGEMKIVNITKQIDPLPDFTVTFPLIKSTGEDIRLSLTNNVNESLASRIKPEWYILFWKISNGNKKMTYYNTDFDVPDGDYNVNANIEVVPISLYEYITGRKSLYDVRTLLLRGFDSSYMYNLDILGDSWTDAEELESFMSQYITYYLDSAAEGEPLDYDTLKLKYFKYPVYFKRLTKKDSDGSVLLLDRTTTFSTTLGISIARCLVNREDIVVGVVETSEIKKFCGNMYFEYDSLDREFKPMYSISRTGKRAYTPEPRYNDIKKLF